jgi:dTDP-4-dehydrorhamnose reductase
MDATTDIRVAITGARGRLGATLCSAYATRFKVIPLRRVELDLSRPSTISRRLEGFDFDVLINCAAVTDVDYCERNPEEATAVNADSVSALADACVHRNARLIQVSTDYVFSGSDPQPRREVDRVGPLNVYGHLKARSEAVALSVSKANIVARVSWLFGAAKRSFLDQIIQCALTQERVSAIADKWSSPTYTSDLAGWLVPFITRAVSGGGLYHLANAGGCSWREYGQHGLDCAANHGLPLKARTVDPMRLADMKTFIAPRPIHTVLATEKLAGILGKSPRPWQDAVAEFVGESVRNGRW